MSDKSKFTKEQLIDQLTELQSQMDWKERSFQAFFENVAVGAAKINPEGKFIRVNDNYCSITGYTRDELLAGMGPLDLSPPEERKHTTKPFTDYLSDHADIYKVEKRHLHKDGHEIWVRVSAGAVCDEEGKLLFSAGIIEDISEQKQIEMKLQQNQQRLELAMLASNLGIWQYSVVTGEFSINEKITHMLGYSSIDLSKILNNWQKIIHPENISDIQQAFDAHISGDASSINLQCRIQHFDGYWVWVELVGKVSQRDENAIPKQFTGTLKDISTQKQIDQEGVVLLKRIESMIHQATDVHEVKFKRKDIKSNVDGIDQLSRRQYQILIRVARGMTSTEIAKDLNIGKGTVITHRREMMRRLDLHNVSEVTQYAIRNNLIDH